MCDRLTCQLERHPASVTTGRRFAADALTTWGLSRSRSEPGAYENILLVTTELLANAVKAASTPITLSLDGHRSRVDIGVADDNPAPAVRLPAGDDNPGGLGLLIVETLSERWGQGPNDHSTKEVWAQVPVPAHSALVVDCTLSEP